MDLPFADEIMLFARSAEQLSYMLDKLVTSLGKVGLKLNAAKTKALTTQAQPPKTLTTRAGLEIASVGPVVVPEMAGLYVVDGK